MNGVKSKKNCAFYWISPIFATITKTCTIGDRKTLGGTCALCVCSRPEEFCLVFKAQTPIKSYGQTQSTCQISFQYYLGEPPTRGEERWAFFVQKSDFLSVKDMPDFIGLVADLDGCQMT